MVIVNLLREYTVLSPKGTKPCVEIHLISLWLKSLRGKGINSIDLAREQLLFD